MIYGTQRSYNTYCAPEPKYNNLHLYIGRYGQNAPEIEGEGSYTIWQYSENGKINGIPKAVDLARFSKGYNLADIEL
jgi:lysozyme